MMTSTVVKQHYQTTHEKAAMQAAGQYLMIRMLNTALNKAILTS
jgi:hypothetical protein